PQQFVDTANHDYCTRGSSEVTEIVEGESSRHGLLSELKVTRLKSLSPKAQYLYRKALYFRKRAAAATKSNIRLKRRLIESKKLTKSEMFQKIVGSMAKIQSRFFLCQLQNSKKKSRGRRFSLEDKVLALALFKQCGSGYRLLSKIFALPSRKTIMKLLNRIPVRPGICEPIFDILKVEVKQFKNPLDKYCVLIFDEMSLKSAFQWNMFDASVEGFEDFGYKRTNRIANHVQVFMLRGIRRKWKQPVAYHFVNGATKYPDIMNIVKSIISKCNEIGLCVMATICDQGTNNEAAIRELIDTTKQNYLRNGVTLEENIFEVENRKVVPIFDPPHLIKGMRNNFLKHNVVFKKDGQKYEAKWEHIIQAYKMDPYLGSLRTMPKLTEKHVNPNNFNKMKVAYCTQVLSRTVAVSLNLMAFSGTTVYTEDGALTLDKEAVQTAKFIEFMDNLFDSVNGSLLSNPLKPLKEPIGDSSKHFVFWNEAKEILSSIRFKKSENSLFIPPTVKNFIKTIDNFKVLYSLLKDVGFDKISPRRFNQDPLENFFGQIRQRGMRYTNPTCAAFTPLYKSLLVKDLTSSHSLGASCEDDESEILITLQRFVSQVCSDLTVCIMT
ncbi:hypothetical protein NQ315_016256, partial [Exocentrus adspersus]